jgi:hypothetical protein
VTTFEVYWCTKGTMFRFGSTEDEVSPEWNQCQWVSLSASYLPSTAAGLATALQDADMRQDSLPTTTARDLRSARFLLNLGTVQSTCHAIPLQSRHTPLPQPRHQCAVCFASLYRQLSVVPCRFLSCMLNQASTPPVWVPAGSGERRSPPRRFRTRHAGAVAALFVQAGVLVLVVRC